jgi:hypothetical protein
MPSASSVSASSPFVSALQQDAWGAVEAGDADLTSSQRVITIGTPIQVVFCKHVAGAGGAWVTPPAARIGAKYDEVAGVTSTVGLVVSDGRIGDIATGDVYKGATVVTGLTNGASLFRYGGMPDIADGYDWQSSQTVSKGQSDILSFPISTGYTVNKSGVLSFNAQNIRVEIGHVTYMVSHRLYINGVLDTGNTSVAANRINISKTFAAPTDVRLEIISYNYGEGKPYPAGATLFGQIDTTFLSTSTVTDETSGFPLYPGSGGTFEGLSCLAVKGGYPKEGGVSVPSTVTGEAFSGGFITSYSVAKTKVTQFSITVTNVKSSNVNQVFGWAFYANNVLVESNGGSWPNTITKSYSYQNPVDARFELTSYNGGAGKPYPAGTVVTGTVSYTGLGAPQGAKSPDTYSDQVRCFVRNGIQVYNVLTGATASSDNFADLAYYLLTQCGKASPASIDIESFRKAAAFTAANGLTFNGVIASLSNVREYLQAVAPFFLLRFTTIDGKYALAPALPIDANGAFVVDAVTPVASFDKTVILEGSYSRTYVAAAERRERIVLVPWRNQSTADYSVVNTAEIRYKDEPNATVYESFDASGFCTSFSHAALVGRYFQVKRRRSVHSIVFSVSADKAVGLKSRDVITVSLDSETTLGSVAPAALPYQVESISDAPNGVTTIEASYFPLDGDGKSLFLLDMLGEACEVK